MSNFVVSARKYRPDHFNSVVGQSHITRTLKTAIKNNQLAQAFLFCGPRGVGKTSCARILAKTINCTNIGEDFEACDVCDSCVSFRNGTSFNIHELDAASNNSVEDIRALVEQVRYAPQAGKYKIYIIDEVHMLSSSAFNAFLKTLEEPPSYAIFILATTEKQKIIPTILSRCQIFEFHRIQVKDIASHLAYIADSEHIVFEPEALHIIAQKADGALRDALSSFDQLSIFTDGKITYKEVIENLNILDYDYYFKVTDALLAHEIPQVLLIFDEILRNGFNGNDFMNGLCSHFRDLLVSRDSSTVKLLEVTEQTRTRYTEQTSRATLSFLLSALAIGNQCELNYRTSKNPRLQVELALIKICHIDAAFRLKDNPEREKKNFNPDSPAAPVAVPASLPVQAPVTLLAPIPPPAFAAHPAVQNQSDPAPLNPVSAPPMISPVQLPPMQVTDPVSPAPGQKAEDPAEPALLTVKNKALPVRFRIPSTAEMLKKLDPKVVEEAALMAAEEEDERPIDADQLITHWKSYCFKPEIAAKINVFTILTAYDPELENGRFIQVKVENTFQRDILAPEIPDLLKFMRDMFMHRSLYISIRIMEVVEDKKQGMYSALDKFNYLAGKNPVLNDFKARLDLEIER